MSRSLMSFMTVEKMPCVYLLTNKRNGTLYTGVTSMLLHRVWQDRAGVEMVLPGDMD